MITYIDKHIPRIFFGSTNVKYVYRGQDLIWSRSAIDSKGFLKYFYGNFDLKFINIPIPLGNPNALRDQFFKAFFLPSTVQKKWKSFYNNTNIFSNTSIPKEFNNKIIVGVFDQNLLNPVFLEPVIINGNPNALSDQFFKAFFQPNDTVQQKWIHYYDKSNVFIDDSLPKEFNNIAITGIDQKLLHPVFLEPTIINGDPNALSDQFFKAFFLPSTAQQNWIHYYDNNIVLISDSIPKEFNSTITGVFDQNLLNPVFLEPTIINGDPNAVSDQFFKSFFLPETPKTYTTRLDESKIFEGDDIWKEFWYSEAEIFDQKFQLSNSNISTFFKDK